LSGKEPGFVEDIDRINLKGDKEMAIRRIAVLAVSSLLLLFSSAAFAQEESAWHHGEVSVLGTGFFTKNSQGNGISQHATDTGGFLAGYRYHFNGWLAAEANYGYNRNTQQTFTSGGPFNVQSNIHQATAALVVTLPVVTLPGSHRVNPYVLAGAGALVFDPTNKAGQSVPGALRQAKAAFVYGGGVDFPLVRHVALRAEYRGFVYNRPDFQLAVLDSHVTAHTAEPSAGLVFRF
jgi:opacity protein-like surface antigen